MKASVVCIAKDKHSLSSELSHYLSKHRALGTDIYIFDKDDHGVEFDLTSEESKSFSYSNALLESLKLIDSDSVMVIHDDAVPEDSTLNKLLSKMKDGISAVYAVSPHRGYVTCYVDHSPYIELYHESDRKIIQCVCGDDGCVLWNRADLVECLPANLMPIGRSFAPINYEIGLRLIRMKKKSIVATMVKYKHNDR